MINGRTHFRIAEAKVSDINVAIDKGSNYFFLKALAKDL